jgi:hypothetical protein
VADDFVQLNLPVFAAQFGLNLKEPTQPLLRGKRTQAQHIWAEGSLDSYQPMVLFDWHINPVFCLI